MVIPNGLGTKAFDSPAQEAARRSVVQAPPAGTEFGAPMDASSGLLWMAASAADEFPQWGTSVTYRDRLLRQFVTAESTLASAFGTVVARNIAFSWTLDGPETAVDAAHEMIMRANAGKGWLDFASKLNWDLLTQDKGAFVEIIRTADDPRAPVVGFQTLDAQRCWHTGRPEQPVIYQDINGKWHRLTWYQVITLAEMPAPHETLYGLQYCAMSRVLNAAQVYRNIAIYMAEKTGGRNPRAMHIVSGVARNVIEDAKERMAAKLDARGALRYVQPLIVAGIGGDSKPEHVTVELASLPDGFDPEKEFKQYLTILSMGLLSDYQEFSPLPGGGLGTGAQSEILHQKTRGKGPALYMKTIEFVLNFGGILPRGVQFRFDEQDLEAEQIEATNRQSRASTRSVQVASGEIDAMGARQLALDAGDIPQELFDEISDREDLTEEPRRDTRIADDESQEGGGNRIEDVDTGTRELAAALARGVKEPALVPVREFLLSRLHRAFTVAADDLRSLGYMGTDERIKLSGAIGGVLEEAGQVFDREVVEAMRRNLEAEDTRLLVGARELNENLAGPEDERLDFERETAESIGRALARVRRNVARMVRNGARM